MVEHPYKFNKYKLPILNNILDIQLLLPAVSGQIQICISNKDVTVLMALTHKNVPFSLMPG